MWREKGSHSLLHTSQTEPQVSAGALGMDRLQSRPHFVLIILLLPIALIFGAGSVSDEANEVEAPRAEAYRQHVCGFLDKASCFFSCLFSGSMQCESLFSSHGNYRLDPTSLSVSAECHPGFLSDRSTCYCDVKSGGGESGRGLMDELRDALN